MTRQQKYIWLAILALGIGLWLCKGQPVNYKLFGGGTGGSLVNIMGASGEAQVFTGDRIITNYWTKNGWTTNRPAVKLPPAPKKPAQVLHSSKDTPARVLAWPVAHTNYFRLVWDLDWNGLHIDSPFGCVVEYKTNLSQPWVELGRVTNKTEYPRATVNKQEFFRVGSFWP
jgi:hypothetical protein